MITRVNRLNSNVALNGLVETYINTAYDKVRVVADNMDIVEQAASIVEKDHIAELIKLQVTEQLTIQVPALLAAALARYTEVDNTRDADKPISSATQTALNSKQNSIQAIHSITNSTAIDVATLVGEYNTLLDGLRNAGLLSR